MKREEEKEEPIVIRPVKICEYLEWVDDPNFQNEYFTPCSFQSSLEDPVEEEKDDTTTPVKEETSDGEPVPQKIIALSSSVYKPRKERPLWLRKSRCNRIMTMIYKTKRKKKQLPLVIYHRMHNK